MMRRRSIILRLLVLVLLLALLPACALGRATNPEATGAPVAISVEVDTVLGPGDFDLPDPRAGLAELSSYRSTLIVTFDGTQDGQASTWSSTSEMLHTKDPLVSQLTIEAAGDLSEEDADFPAYIATMNGAEYEREADGACNAKVFDPQNSLIAELEPAALLTAVLGAESAGHENVNGIESDHYTFDARALAMIRLAPSAGEVWVASDGGYVVRYLLNTTSDELYFGEGTEGTVTWQYDLTDVNMPVTIELPDDCPSGLVDAPLLPDATNLSNQPGLLQYDTASSVAEARALYEEELPKLGWQLPALVGLPEGVTQEEYERALELLQNLGGPVQPTPTPNPDEAFLVFYQGDQALQLIITRNGSTTQVVLLLVNRPE